MCMHGLQATEIIALARCSQRMLALAEASFAWKQQPLLTVHVRRDEDSPPHFSVVSRILRHTPPVKMVCNFRPNTALSPAKVARIVEWMQCIPNLQVIEARRMMLPIAAWFSVFSHPCAQQLRSLSLHAHWRCHPDFSSDAVTCPQLFSVILKLLHLSKLACHSDGPHAGCWSTVASAPALTDLSVRDSPFSGPSSMPLIAQCNRLRALGLDAPALGGAWFKKFFSQPGKQRLEVLRLTRLIVSSTPMLSMQPVPPQDYTDAFASMTQLHTLRVDYCTNPDLLLCHVSSAPALRQVSIRVRCDGNMARGFSPDVVATMMTDKPDLHCDLVMHRTEPTTTAIVSPGSMDHLSTDPLHMHFLTAPCMHPVLDRFTVKSVFFNAAGELDEPDV